MTRWRSMMSRSFVFSRESLPLGVLFEDNQGEYDFHSHENFVELVIVRRGRALHLVDKLRYPIGPGDVFVILGDREHAYCNIENLALINILFDPDRLRLPLYDLTSSPGYQVLFRIDAESLMPDRFDNRFRLDYRQLDAAEALARRLGEIALSGRPGEHFHAISALLSLMSCVVEAYESNATGSHLESMPHRLGELASFMEQNHTRALAVDEMCVRTGLSRSNLFRQFRLYLKSSPLDYLLGIRLRHAKELLAGSGLGISEIALRCGFNDGNYFSRQFHRHCGVTPKDFRRDFAGQSPQ